MKSDFDTEPSMLSSSSIKHEADEPMENICLPLLRKKNPKLKYLNPKMRNAGRKKSNPAWEYFEDLRPGGILQGVRCRHCDFYSEDRSPTMMKYHIKRKHDTGPGGLWEILNDCYDRLGSHKYIPKKRAKILSMNGEKRENDDENTLDWEEEENLTGFPPTRNLHEESDGPSSVQSLSMYEGTGDDGITADSSTSSQAVAIHQLNNNIENDSEYSAEMEKLATNILQLTAMEESNSYKSSLPKVEMWDRAMDLSQKTRPRNANNWTYLATFDNEDEMHQVRIREKVSKRREEMLKNGRKVRYRCNKWKSTKCGFQMFALFANDKIDLYETGVHDHTGDRIRNHIEKMRSKGVIVAPPGPRQPSQSQILRRLLKQSVNQKRHQVITITAYNGEKEFVSENGDLSEPKMNVNFKTENINSNIPSSSSITHQNDTKDRTDEMSSVLAKRVRKAISPSKMESPSSKVQRIEAEKESVDDDELPLSSEETDFDHVLQGMGWISEKKSTSLKPEAKTKKSFSDKQQEFLQKNNEQKQKSGDIDINIRRHKQQEKTKNHENNAIQRLLDFQNGLTSDFNGEDFASFCAAMAAADPLQSDFTTNFEKVASAAATAMTIPDLSNDASTNDYLEEEVVDRKSPPIQTPSTAAAVTTFSLADMTRVSELVEIASDLELDLKLCPPGSGTIIEYIFCPKEASSVKSVSISEDLAHTNTLDQVVLVRDLINGSTVREETWSKTSWSLFHWAIRGKCSHFFAEKKRKK